MTGARRQRSGPGAQPRGLFVDGVWHCDCHPRCPANHFEVKKEGPNKGKWFRSCQKPQSDEKRCKFFLWDTEAHPREAAALASNSRTEPRQPTPSTPSKRRPTPPPTHTAKAGSSNPSCKRTRAASDSLDDEYGFEKANASFGEELDRIMTAVETPIKTRKTTEFATPAIRRKLPWQTEFSEADTANGLQTPRTDRKTPSNLFSSKASISHSTPSRTGRREDGPSEVRTPCPSPFETPTPSRYTDTSDDGLVQGVFGILQESSVRLGDKTESDLRSLLSRHAKTAEGFRRGRDVIRATVKAKDAKITELTYRISTLEAEIEAEKAMARHLQWEAEADSAPRV